MRLTPGIRAKGAVRSMTIWVPILVFRSVSAGVDGLNPCICRPSDVKFTVINKSGLKKGLGLRRVARALIPHWNAGCSGNPLSIMILQGGVACSWSALNVTLHVHTWDWKTNLPDSKSDAHRQNWAGHRSHSQVLIPWKHVTGLHLRIVNYTYIHKWYDIPDWRLNFEIGRLAHIWGWGGYKIQWSQGIWGREFLEI